MCVVCMCMLCVCRVCCVCCVYVVCVVCMCFVYGVCCVYVFCVCVCVQEGGVRRRRSGCDNEKQEAHTEDVGEQEPHT